MGAIIVGADGSEVSLRAVEWATEEAARRGLPLRIVHAAAVWPYDAAVEPGPGTEAALVRGLLDAAADVARERDPDVAVETDSASGQAARILLDAARDAVMVVLGGRGTGAATGLLLGSTTLQVVTHATVPTVVVRELEPAIRGEVVVGVDGTQISEPAVGFAFEEASLRRARLRMVHVWSHPAAGGPGGMQPLVHDPQFIADEEMRAMEESLAAWQPRHPDVEVVSEVVHGRAVRILSGASARADLLVVGTRGRGGFTGLLLGSVSHALLHHAHCPLAVVPAAR